MNPYGSTRVDGEGPTPCDLMFVGEGPGADEDKWGRPFVGKSGRELNRYIWNSIARTRTSVYVTNLVKYRIPNDGDPTAEDIERDRPELEREITNVRPDVIVAVGRHSTRRWLPGADMETVHGVVHLVGGTIIFPVIHPAAGLHSTEFQGAIAWDFEQLGKLLRGEDVQWAAEDEHPRPKYGQYKPIGPHCTTNLTPNITAVDTEGSIDRPWCLSWSEAPGHAQILRHHSSDTRLIFRNIVLHNALHDLGVLRAMGITDFQFDDTMIMAYLLCVEPQGLKALAKRHCGMEMSSYDDVIGEASKRLAIKYLEEVLKCTEPKQQSKKRSAEGGTKRGGRATGRSTATASTKRHASGIGVGAKGR